MLRLAAARWLAGRIRSPAGLILWFTSEERAMPVSKDEVLQALKECYDPEIPVNIVDLGLIYEVRFVPAPPEAGEGQLVEVEMTMTSPGCPSHTFISQQVKERLERMPGVKGAAVNVVWSPPWGPERLSDEARQKLGIDV
jgi:metal-sulfur cluster biosynthetic enzyme